MSTATALLGAWSPSGLPAKAVLGAECIRAMRAQLPGDTAAWAESARGALWMVAAQGKLVEAAGCCAAYEGFIPEGELRAESLPAALGDADRAGNWRLAPEGHYVLAHAGAGGASLSLLRALSGGERLYYLHLNGLVIFSSSLRPLLAHPRVVRRLNPGKIREALLTGMTLAGDATLIEGISEVPAGHVAHFRGNEVARRWHYTGLLEPLQGSPERLAAQYRQALANAVAVSAGATRPVAVTLSGGIDSAAIAALAVEAFGADSVVAFTYEFDDPAHSSEAPYAAEVCRRLGIRRHRVFKIRFDRFLASIPEAVWRAESFAHWPKAFMMLATREIRDAGFDRYLSGFGIGSHMAFYEDLASLLRWVPAPLVAAYWKIAQSPRMRWLENLERLHPGLARPNLRLRYLLLGLMRGRGMVGEPLGAYSKALWPVLGSLPDEMRADDEFGAMALPDLFRHQGFAHLASCIDVTRWEKPMREVGACRVSPAHYASTIPYAYLNYHPAPPLWSAARQARPGKHLLRIAMKGVLPQSVLQRRKSWADAVVSRSWLSAGTRWMRNVVPEYWNVAGPGATLHAKALRRWDVRSPQTSVTALAFWNRLFVERPPSGEPPTWEELLEGSRAPA